MGISGALAGPATALPEGQAEYEEQVKPRKQPSENPAKTKKTLKQAAADARSEFDAAMDDAIRAIKDAGRTS